jgi:threonylcarbamoyladenosine tRNA methylthiotransferase MtaB
MISWRGPNVAKVYFDSLGCRLNQAEVEMWAREVERAGGKIALSIADADVSVVNTCTVTHVAAAKSRKLIRALHRRNPRARFIITGCHATLNPDRAAQIVEGAEIIVNDRKDALVQEILGLRPDLDAEMSGPGTWDRITFRRTRAFLKVQDGCDHRCTYCVTTLVRGTSRSRPLADILDEARALEAAGYNEIVLTGVHLGAYADAPAGGDLTALVRAILRETGFPRVRLSSLEPWDLPDDFFALWEDPRLCPHLHLPLQSGCASTLKRMARRVTPGEFRGVVDAARAAIPDLAVSTDLMVGFPGEGAGDFEQSLAFAEEMAFSRMHVFRYSDRPGTVAPKLGGRVPVQEAKRRADRARILADRMEAAFLARHAGRTLSILWEYARKGPEGWENAGLTPNYLRVEMAAPESLTNRITDVCIIGASGKALSAMPA